MDVSLLGVVIATCVQFAIGAVWYSALFGKNWMRIMGAGSMTKEELAKMQKKMMPFYLVELGLTFIMTFVLAHYIVYFAPASPYYVTTIVYLGFVVPMLVSTTVWGRTEMKHWVEQIAISAGMRLVALVAGTWVLTLM